MDAGRSIEALANVSFPPIATVSERPPLGLDGAEQHRGVITHCSGAGDQILVRLGGVLCHPQRERLVDVPIAVGELDVEVVQRRAEGHPHIMPGSR